MSKAFLEKLLRQELDSLEKVGSTSDFREDNKQLEHHFIVDLNSIMEEIKKELIARKYVFSEEQWKLIDEIVAEHASLIVSSIRKNLAVGRNSEVKEIGNTGTSFIVKVIEARGFEYSWLTKKYYPATIFGTIRNSFKRRRKNLVDALNSLFKSKEFKRKGGRGTSFNLSKESELITGSILAIGHQEDSAIVSQRLEISRKKITEEINKFSKQNKNNKIWKALESNTYSVLLSKKDTEEKTQIYTSIESSRYNSLRGSTEERKLKTEYITALKKAIEDLNNNIGLENIEGSDSRLTIEKKKQIKTFIESVKKDKRIKKVSVNTKIKLSNAKVKKTKKQKNTKSVIKNTISSEKIALLQSATKPSTINLAVLKSQINAKLSMTVIKNMGTPALENRTGRFARSVQVTDVTQTSKGFPSIGYTYQKYPYQTFEPGFKQGSTQRDPRTLIDRSIRDIAKDLIVGRFYTRRV